MQSDALVLPRSTTCGSVAGLLQQLVLLLNDWYWRARTRRQLAALDARGLKDIGLSECDRQRELAKPFWQ